jgi:uncharacterized Zn-binding protein involved in type VI secretion
MSMGKKIAVENDAVEGADWHHVSGTGPNPSAPPPTLDFVGLGRFDYKGKMTDQLSDFVSIGGKPVALVTSKSSLDPGQTAPPSGKHAGMSGSGFIPQPGPAPSPSTPTLSITDPVGEGRPSASAGSSFVKIGGAAVLLDGDKIDTCDGLSVPMNSTVTASGQDFATCSA